MNIILPSNFANDNIYYAIATDENDDTKYCIEELNLLICPKYYNIDRTDCLDSVPDGYYCDNPNDKTIALCDTKCSKCDKESQEKNKCIICNNDNNYYGKYEEINSEYKTCNNKNTILDGYYFDSSNNIFKKCFRSCKSCSETGTESNHKCEECISGYQFNSEIGTGKNCY